MITLASRLDTVAPSASVVMTQRSRELAASGAKVIALTQGQPDFPTPPHAIEAANRAALEGQTKYPPLAGTAPIKEAIRRKFNRENGLDYELDEILVGNGGKQILYNAMMATLNPGDEVIIPRPFWISYADMARLGGATPVPVDCPQSNGFKLRPEELEAAITPRTRWVVLNFPNNPTGAACTWAEMRAIADVVLRHPQVMVLSDDMYEHLLYDGFEFCTIAQVEPALRDRVLTVNGVSKTYAMTGWRVGYCGGPRALIKGMTNMQGQSTGGASSIGQAAAVAALDGPQDFLKERAESFRVRRNLVVEMLNEARGVTCHKPEGAFYVFPDISGCIGRTTPGGRRITTDAEFAMALLEEAHVGTVYGAAYGMSPHVRISYAIKPDDLREGCARIQEFCQGLR
ncbi:pyridoxal phosphate-dependent aminotransferase [Roseomonas populi]|uniref:Aminotransferase n=1 Tax=Roseomonas populi TaxID=3121582 RepID=A0ABT1X028_9PROT|nr:pyridoxal phosphate-dependent aminotransferase [Roseomonas pecuniae]MCR0981457.1 pyridoxal phosphate-dependent aminotransferase [Roseomonas pecuniae]